MLRQRRIAGTLQCPELAHSGLFELARPTPALGGKADTPRNGSADAFMITRPS